MIVFLTFIALSIDFARFIWDFPFLFDIILSNLVQVGKEVQLIMNNFLNSMYFGQISKKWNSVSIWCWLQKVHSLCSLSIFWNLPAYIAKLCADNQNCVNCVLSLSF